MEEQMVKIQLRGPDAGELETPWATPIGANPYRLENSPFFAYGISWEDIVEAHLDEHECLEFTRCVTKSGNRTVRAIADFSQNNAKAQIFLKELEDLQCSYEGMYSKLISINIPPGINLDHVTNFLTGHAWIKWEYADPTFEEITNEAEPH
jgi:hypothetical protein